jgi:Peptidase family M28
VIIGLAVAAGLLPRRWALVRSVLAGGALAGLVSEGGLIHTPLSDALARGQSQNLVGTIEPSQEPRRTVCLVCHLDTSRSGLLFHPNLVQYLNRGLQVLSAACVAQAAEPVLARSRLGRKVLAASRCVLAAGGALLIERELRGEDVPGGNDNASGVGVVAQLSLELLASPPKHTRVVVLMTGCEESLVLGSQAFLRSHDTSGWLFLNFDNIGGDASLRYLRQEGVARLWDADAGLLELAARISADDPALGLQPSEGPIGLTYDATPVLARGGRAITFVAADNGVIPNYHWPTDTADNVDAEALERALEAGRRMVAAIDRGEAD